MRKIFTEREIIEEFSITQVKVFSKVDITNKSPLRRFIGKISEIKFAIIGTSAIFKSPFFRCGANIEIWLFRIKM